MDSETEKSLEALLRKASLKTAPLDLTDKIMHRIDAEAAETTALEPELRKLIQLHTVKTPPTRLGRRIESELFPASQNYAPIISRRTWYTVMICVMILLTGGCLIFPSETGSRAYDASSWLSLFYKLPSLTSSIPEEYLAGLFILFMLLAIDFLLRYKPTRNLMKV